MTEAPPVEGEEDRSVSLDLPISEEQLSKYVQDTVSDYPELFPSSQSQTTLGSDSEGVIENILENGEEIMRDLVFKKIFENYIKPWDFPGQKNLDIKLPNMTSNKSAYSSSLDKLFIQRNTALSFSLTYDGATNPGAQYSVLASVIFTDPIYANLPVKVCPNHRDRWDYLRLPVTLSHFLFPVPKGILLTTS